jgi:acetoin utilization deacetylase AcuC-like enzyme
MGSSLYFSHPACLEHETTGGHPERPARITAIESWLADREWLGYEVRQAPPASREALVAVHSAEYVDAVREMSDSGGGAFDQENIVSARSYSAAAHASGAACAMVEALLAEGPARIGFCATRPPGHHARVDTTSGFCLFNHVAVATRHALDSLGARRVFIFDWDMHHGDGTNDIFRATNAVLFASIHQRGAFPGTGPLTDAGSRTGEGYSINLPVEKGSYEDAWFSMLEHIVIPAAEEFQPDLVLISAGYDGHRDDPLGGCELEASSFAEMARHLRGWESGPGRRWAPCWRVDTHSTRSPPRSAQRWRHSPASSRRTPLRRISSLLEPHPTSAFTGDCERPQPRRGTTTRAGPAPPATPQHKATRPTRPADRVTRTRAPPPPRAAEPVEIPVRCTYGHDHARSCGRRWSILCPPEQP